MKKLLLSTLFLLSVLAYGQVTTTPTIPTANDEITITFDATGTPLENYTGTIYAHTGATVNGADWQNVIGTWGNNTTQPELTNTSGSIYEFTITPNIYTYYNINTTSTITQLSFVFRSSDGGTQTTDIFVPIYDDGLNITITNPDNNDVFNLSDIINIEAEISAAADLEIFVNDISQQTTTNSTSIITSYTFNSTGNYTIKAVATQGAEIVEDEINVFVPTATQNEPLPANVANGFNDNGDGTVTFVLLAPNKSSVYLIGDFNTWQLNENYQMKKDGDYFWITVNGLNADTEYTYQYYIDFSIKIADPYSEKILDPNNDQYIPDTTYPNLISYPDGKTEGIVSTFKINEEEYVWQNTSFTKPDKENLIIYELLVRDFTETDTFKDAITHLDYLEQLGINAIELMPVNEFEGNDSWGYNPSFYMALDKAYGTKNDLKEFIDECHKRGIAVLADVVFNHSYGQSPLLHMYWDSSNNSPSTDSPFYNTSHNLVDNTSAHWGYDFNHESTYTVNFFNDVLGYWMSEYKIDGFRFDFTKGFSNTIYTGADNWASAYDADRIAILKAYADHVWAHDPGNEAYVIFEHLAENSEETELANYGIMLWGNMNHSYNQNTMGYSSDADISWISYQNRGWNNPHVVGYMESHDEERLMFKNLEFGNSEGDYDITVLETALDRMETAGAFFFTVPGPKMIWQFGELGYDVSIDFNGRTGNKPIRWEYFDVPARKEVYDAWSKLIKLKLNEPVFKTDNFTIDAGNSSGLKSIHLTLDSAGNDELKHVTIIGNFGVSEQLITPDFQTEGVWYEFLNGNLKYIVTDVEKQILLQPGEFRIFGNQPTSLLPNDNIPDDDSDGVINDDDLCPETPLGARVDYTGCEIFNLPETNFTLSASSETCRNADNGTISVTVEENLVYNVSVSGNGLNISDSFNTANWILENLIAGEYEICFSVEGEANYQQCFNAIITQPEDLAVASKINSTSGKLELNLKGGDMYFVTLNGVTTETDLNYLELSLKAGVNKISVSTGIECQGKYEKDIFVSDKITYYPNPTTNKVILQSNTQGENINIEIFTSDGRLVKKLVKQTEAYSPVSIETAGLKPGNYLFRITGKTINTTIKIIKQ
ncbi:alpha-amylase family glycosyl hydrolase [Abyssalbus ytuae]|uniref:Alpha-amylase family glycosyl hydrolase n=1 Tax=Abyssalbus ytuae TaxID=2926907 RepID=A0A9E6ZPZ8_9FLAO|nr:alpha-amylase family glycosyl hydrolase [Abyssalbus ytuae]UOB18799.1 alpha-amylase family glycosyl hydrolase [Abyssalbus ytuae]